MADYCDAELRDVSDYRRFKDNFNRLSAWNIIKRTCGDLIMTYGAVALAILIRRIAKQQTSWFDFGNDIVTNILIAVAFALLLAKQKWRNHIKEKETGVVETLILIIAIVDMVIFVIASVLSTCDWILVKKLMHITFGISVFACLISNIDLDVMAKEKKISDSMKQTNGSVGNTKFKV